MRSGGGKLSKILQNTPRKKRRKFLLVLMILTVDLLDKARSSWNIHSHFLDTDLSYVLRAVVNEPFAPLRLWT
jgi:hypothetical protein